MNRDIEIFVQAFWVKCRDVIRPELDRVIHELEAKGHVAHVSTQEYDPAAAQAYLDMIVASRAEEGRRAFDDARARWSEEFGVTAEDALCMREMVPGATTLVALVEQLDGCGPDRKQVKEALERMLEKGLITPIENARS